MAALASLGQSVQPFTMRNPKLTLILPLVTLAGVLLAFLCLVYGFYVSDFSLKIVFEHSHTLKPDIYKIAGTWGNHEGSMLLWVLVLAGYGAALAGGYWPKNHQQKSMTLAVQGGLTFIFLLFAVLTSNPFALLDVTPPEGLDLNPLLQDPALAFHPPMLYLGYVGFSIVFAFAMAGLWYRSIDKVWAGHVYPWVLAAWLFLTAGIALGSYWAYYELGWGGWWFWDPVENASLMPWLTGTALLHSVSVLKRRNMLARWVVFLSLLTFILSILGTFLVRSGVLVSVHSFASDPSRGLFILAILMLVALGGFWLYAHRAASLPGKGWFHLLSRESSLVLNNFILSLCAFIVFLGTLYPVFAQTLDVKIVSIGPAYYEQVMLPLFVLMLLGMILVPFLNWQKTKPQAVIRSLNLPGLLTLFVFVYLVWSFPETSLYALLGLTMGIVVCAASLAKVFDQKGRNLPMLLAHFGVGVCVIGMVGSATWKEEKVTLMVPGQEIVFAGHSLTLTAVKDVFGANYYANQADLKITGYGDDFKLHPQRRYYPVADMTTTEAAIHTTLEGDLYILFNGFDPKSEAWIISLIYNPLMIWLWAGVGIIVLSGFFRLVSQRKL